MGSSDGELSGSGLGSESTFSSHERFGLETWIMKHGTTDA